MACNKNIIGQPQYPSIEAQMLVSDEVKSVRPNNQNNDRCLKNGGTRGSIQLLVE